MSNLQYDIVTERMRVKNTGRLLFGGENGVKKVRAMFAFRYIQYSAQCSCILMP